MRKTEDQAAREARPLYKDTIAAIATAPGASGIGIIRISGPDALKIADRVVKGRSGEDLRIFEQPSHTLKYGFVFDGKEPVDEVLLSVFRGPRSYTAEDTAEVNCHGGTFVLRRVLSVILKNGARIAEPGEFTKRAFMNGRIDLTEAESVMDIISAGNEFARKNSLSVLKGEIHTKILGLRDRILHEAAYIESALDDPEHYDLSGYSLSLRETVSSLKKEMEDMIRDFRSGRVLKNGIRTAILGRPNVGKSSIMNLLTGDETVIVTDIPGTTRDVVSSDISLNGIPMVLFDTAGIRDTEDRVERKGVDRSFEVLSKADLVLFVLDSSEELTKEDKDIFDRIYGEGKPCIILKNKSDLKLSLPDTTGFDIPVIEFSAKEGTGIKELKATVEEMFLRGIDTGREDAFITSERQAGELEKAASSLGLVIKSIDDQMTEDFFSVDLMDAYTYLGNIIGEDTDEDLFDRIFSEFCMGK